MSLPASLEALIAAQLESLSLNDDPATVEFVQQIADEDSFEPEDKKSAILGFLELDEADEDLSNAIGELLDKAKDFRDQEAAKAQAEEEEKLAAKPAELAGVTKKVLTPEEDLARKQELLKTYGYLEEDTEEERREREDAGKVPSAVYVDPKLLTKKARKKAEAGVDLLMAPNLNAARVKGAEIHRREEASQKAAAQKLRNDADRKKQKDDAVKKAEDKKKKAAKVERKA